jgi:predicted LPLAT superfamily acyltransferase/GT2 family glycosyltransferase
MFRPCLLIPVYNHGPLVEGTWARLRGFGLPCLMVDDGSDAATADVLDRLAAAEPLVTLLRLPQNRGKGAASLLGIAEAHRLGYTHALQIDADGQHNADDIPAMLAMAEQEPAALISGAPQYGDDIPKARLYGRYITHFWVWVETLSFDITDSMCGFRVYPVAATHALAQQTRIGQRMTFDTDIMVRLYWAGTPVRFLPTRVSYPPDGISHFRPLRDNLQISAMHTRLVCGMLWRACRGELPVTRDKHWSQQAERGSAWGLRLSLWCYRRLGPSALQLLLYCIIGWFFLFAGNARRESQRYLARVLQRPPTLADSFRHFLAFGRAIVDKLAAWNGAIRHTHVHFHQRQLLLEQKASGKGCVILTSHLGNTEVCRALSGYVDGLKLNVLLFTQNARQINRVLHDVNPDSSMEIIEVGNIGPDTAIRLHEKVQRGEFVVIAADRTSPTAMHRVSLADFLGAPAAFPQGPFILAALLECPVYLLFALHNGRQYELFVEPFAERLHFPRRQREALLGATVQRYAGRLQHYCRLAPLQWFNFYNFWQVPDSRQDND